MIYRPQGLLGHNELRLPRLFREEQGSARS